MNSGNPKFVFFGTPMLSVWVLEELKNSGFFPSLIVTTPDVKVGRKQVLTPTPTKIWGQKNSIPVFEVATFRNKPTPEFLQNIDWDFFVVAAYNFILPENILNTPKKGVLNVHPSLLPEMRGPSPVRSSILLDKRYAVGVSIILLDKEVDHGPILVQKNIDPHVWPTQGHILDEILFREGGRMLSEIIPKFMNNEIEPQDQDHSKATFSKKFTKQDGLVDLSDEAYGLYLKYCAFDIWPRIYYFDENKKRVIVTDATLEDGKFIIKKIIPEGGKERDY